jgi:hypothetical protein
MKGIDCFEPIENARPKKRSPLCILKFILRLIGLLSMVLAACALIYIGMSLLIAPGIIAHPKTPLPPHFVPTFYVMAAAAVILSIAMAWSGWAFAKGDVARVLPFVLACACLDALPVIVRRLAGNPNIGHSIARATGITMGGFHEQWAIRFPIWAPLVVLLIWWYGIGRAART